MGVVRELCAWLIQPHAGGASALFRGLHRAGYTLEKTGAGAHEGPSVVIIRAMHHPTPNEEAINAFKAVARTICQWNRDGINIESTRPTGANRGEA